MKKQFSAEFVLHALMGTLLAVTLAACYVGYRGAEQAQPGAAMSAARDVGAAGALARAADASMRALVAEADEAVARGAAGATEAQAAALRRQQQAAAKQADEARQLLGRHGLDAGALSAAGPLAARVADEQIQRLQQAAAGTPAAAGTTRWGELAPAVDALAQQHAARVQADSASQLEMLAYWLGAVLAAGVALAWFFRAWIRRANVGPLRTATKLVQRVAGGDLTANVDGMDFLHTRKIAEALNGMTANLRGLIGEVATSARTVADTSAQIAQGNLDLSQRTEEQASTLEETASSMEELTSTVAHNADNARQASQLAVNASEVARKGGQVVGQVVHTMTDISQSSRKIGDIIGVIDGIAFQTNILALNAAVEAARAGEQGRGFAVVAAEVRNLAQRSAAAAKEIKALISDSVGKVEAGTRLVDTAGTTMQEIVSSVKQVSDLIAEIAAASQEQSAGIGQVNTAVAQMEQVVQQNASLVEQATAATESMKEQAAALLQTVSRFKVGEQGAAAPTPLRALHPASSGRAPAPVAPAPIRVRSSTAALPPAYAAAVASATRKPRSAGGEWEEF